MKGKIEMNVTGIKMTPANKKIGFGETDAQRRKRLMGDQGYIDRTTMAAFKETAEELGNDNIKMQMRAVGRTKAVEPDAWDQTHCR